jgi:hypothetical protein
MVGIILFRLGEWFYFVHLLRTANKESSGDDAGRVIILFIDCELRVCNFKDSGCGPMRRFA